MKKFLAILLAMMLVMVSVAALAADNPDILDKNRKKNETSPFTVKITKAYKVTSDTNSALVPKHDVSFDVEQLKIEDTAFPNVWTDTPLTAIAHIAEGAPGDDESTTDVDEGANLEINIPAYSHPGVYWYKLTEIDGHIAGVTPNDNTFYLKVTVWNDDDTLRIGGVALRDKENDKTTTTVDGVTTTTYGEKIDIIEDTYTAGELLISKTVAGKMGDYDKEFTFKVTFTPKEVTIPSATEGGQPTTINETVSSTITVKDAGTESGAKFNGDEIIAGPTDDDPEAKPTVIAGGWSSAKSVTVTLKHNQAVLFENIPENVTYKVTENEAGKGGYVTTIDGTTVTISGIADTANADNIKQAEGTIAKAKATAAFTNTKDITIDTGITLETLPYVLLMALAMMGLVVLKLRKREEY